MNWINKFLRCRTFAEHEDTVFQRVTILGMLLRRIEKITNDVTVREHCSHGITVIMELEQIFGMLREQLNSGCKK